jgi:hypothetical protein
LAESTQEIQRRSRQFATATVLLGLVIVAVFAVTMASAFRAPAADQPELQVMYAVYWLPTLFYLWALLAIRRIFLDIGSGALFAPAVAKGLRQIGWALLSGGAVNLVVIRVIQNSYLPRGFSTGETHLFRGLNFDPAYVMLILIGLALLLLGRLMTAAADQSARAERLETELGEFL